LHGRREEKEEEKILREVSIERREGCNVSVNENKYQ